MIVAGVDEVGRGPLAGPVVSAAVILSSEVSIEGLIDSKKLSAKNRRIKSETIWRDAAACSIAEASVEEIDQLNILQATLLSMSRAVAALSMEPDLVLVDGIHLPQLRCAAESVIKGDQLHSCISAASIIAKVYRDALMKKLSHEFPYYGLERNKGYPTREHLVALRRHGASDIHRRSFRPVKECL